MSLREMEREREISIEFAMKNCLTRKRCDSRNNLVLVYNLLRLSVGVAEM